MTDNRGELTNSLVALADTLSFSCGRATAVQSCFVPSAFPADSFPWLASFAAGYLSFRARLPLLAVAPRPVGGHVIGPILATNPLALLSFAPPYLVAARSGHEIRYPIVGGLLAHAPGGYLACGSASENAGTRLWIAVHDFHPRLGLGPLYVLTQVQLHRLISIAYMHTVVQSLLQHEPVHSRQSAGSSSRRNAKP